MNKVTFFPYVSREQPIQSRESPRSTVLVNVLQLATYTIVKAADFNFMPHIDYKFLNYTLTYLFLKQ